MVEIGILHGGASPEHVCPFGYLDPSVKSGLLKRTDAMYTAWKAFRGDPTLYDQSRYTIPGCLTLTALPG